MSCCFTRLSGISEMLRAKAQANNFRDHERDFSLIIEVGECFVDQWSFESCQRHAVS